MKKSFIAIVSVLALSASAYAQNSIPEVLKMVESNNPTLSTAAKEADLQKLENREGAILADPEIEFNYLWGQNAEVGNRHDVRVTQSFDIPALTGMRVRQAGAQNEQADMKYKAERLNVLLEAEQLCLDIIYCNALEEELNTHLEHAGTLVKATERKMELGEANELEVNKAKLHLASVKGQISKIDVERKNLLSKLEQLNGGEAVDFTLSSYPSGELPADFNTWYADAAAKNPVLRYVEQEIEICNNQIKIDKASWLPNLNLGYMSEIGLSDKYRGVTLGISIPLWRNTNKIRQSMTRINIANERKAQEEKAFYNRLLREYNEASGLKDISDSYREVLRSADSRTALLEAEARGEISMIDYLVETDLYYETVEESLAAERDYQKSLAELNSINL